MEGTDLFYGIMSPNKTVELIYYNNGTMESLRVKELREIARSRGLKGWYRLRKSDLISLIVAEETQIERRRQEQFEQATAEANAKAAKKAKLKARRQAKQEEAKREAERRIEVKRSEANQRKQKRKNITGTRPETKETKSQRKQRKRLELEYETIRIRI